LEELICLAISFSKKLAAGKEGQGGHFTNYLAWLNQQDTTVWDAFDMLELFSRIKSLAEQLGHNPAAISKICANLGSILSDPKKAFGVLDDGDCLERLKRYMKEYDNSAFVRALGHLKPNLRILELDAGTGTATREILKHLTRADGQTLYSRYVFADASMGKVHAAKDRFKSAKNIEYAVLDSKSLVDQGFEDRHFDLIILTGLLHTSPRIQQSWRTS
jgi:SAM-dependent methyltransferase